MSDPVSKSYLQGLTLAFRNANAMGTFSGAELALDTYDDMGDPKAALKFVTELSPDVLALVLPTWGYNFSDAFTKV